MSSEQFRDSEPHPNHEWLHQLIGDWTIVNESRMGPDEPLITMTGTESVRKLGNCWILGEGRGEMPGGAEGRMLLTLGFDVAQDCFVGSWIGTMMTNLWIYRGSLDADRRILTLDTEGQSKTGEITRYQDIHEIVSPEQRIQRSMVQGKDGQWRQMMEANYSRA